MYLNYDVFCLHPRRSAPAPLPLPPFRATLAIVVCCLSCVCVGVCEFFPLQFFLASTKPPTSVHVLVPLSLCPFLPPNPNPCPNPCSFWLTAWKVRYPHASDPKGYASRDCCPARGTSLSLWFCCRCERWSRCPGRRVSALRLLPVLLPLLLRSTVSILWQVPG